MATATIQNISTSQVYIRDLYDSLEPGETVVLQRSLGQLGAMFGLHEALTAGTISLVSLVTTPAEDTFGGTAPSYSNTTRPAATGLRAGFMIWNTDDNAPNFSDGTSWRDANGLLT